MKIKQVFFSTLKITLFVLLITLVQTSLVTDIFPSLPIDLVFCSLIVIVSYLDLYSSIAAAAVFCAFSAMLFYDGDIYWLYIVFAMLASRINPEQIPDKFLICILYTICLTPLHELFSPSSEPYLDRTMQLILLNTITVIPLFFITKFAFPSGNYNSNSV